MNEVQPYVERRLRLHNSDAGEEAIVRIYPPVQLDEIEWRCRFSIQIPDSEQKGEAFGVDGLQALILAIRLLERRISETCPRSSWLGGEEGDTGFPMILLSCLPFPESKRMRSFFESKISDYLAPLSRNDKEAWKKQQREVDEYLARRANDDKP